MDYNLFLDDIRNPKQVSWVSLPLVEWTIVRNYEQFTDIITKQGLPNCISFDHDLSYEHYPTKDEPKEIDYDSYKEKTGYDCAKWLVDYCFNHKLPAPLFYVHSINPVGAQNIKAYINAFRRTVENQKQ